MRAGSASCAELSAPSLEGSDGLTPMMSACAAAKRSIRGPPPATKIGGPPGRYGAGDPSSPADLKVLAGEVKCALREQAPQHRDVLDQPIHPHPGRIHRDPGSARSR